MSKKFKALKDQLKETQGYQAQKTLVQQKLDAEKARLFTKIDAKLQTLIPGETAAESEAEAAFQTPPPALEQAGSGATALEAIAFVAVPDSAVEPVSMVGTTPAEQF